MLCFRKQYSPYSVSEQIYDFLDRTCMQKSLIRSIYGLYKQLRYLTRRKHYTETEIMVFCIYAALLKADIFYPLSVLAMTYDVKEKKILTLQTRLSCKIILPPLSCEAYISRVAYIFDFTFKEKEMLCQLMEAVKQLFIFSPLSILGACIYFYLYDIKSLRCVTFNDVAPHCYISESTLQRVYKKIFNNLPRRKKI